MRGSQNLDDVLREIKKEFGFTRKQASDFVAQEIKGVMNKNKSCKNEKYKFGIW